MSPDKYNFLTDTMAKRIESMNAFKMWLAPDDKEMRENRIVTCCLRTIEVGDPYWRVIIDELGDIRQIPVEVKLR